MLEDNVTGHEYLDNLEKQRAVNGTTVANQPVFVQKLSEATVGDYPIL